MNVKTKFGALSDTKINKNIILWIYEFVKTDGGASEIFFILTPRGCFHTDVGSGILHTAHSRRIVIVGTRTATRHLRGLSIRSQVS